MAQPKLSRGTLADLGDAMHLETSERLGAILAGYSYLGQFIDHDIIKNPNAMTLADLGSTRRGATNSTSPSLDLSSVYPGNPKEYEIMVDGETGKMKKGDGSFRSGTTSMFTDLLRTKNGIALVPDHRNDENLLIAQLHVLFINFHNYCIDELSGKKHPPKKKFEIAKKYVIACYHHIVKHDFLKTILESKIYDIYFSEGCTPEYCKIRDTPIFFQSDTIPVEFSAAAFRFGHAFVRNSYKLRIDGPELSLQELFYWTGGKILDGRVKFPDKLVVDWSLFFEVSNLNPTRRQSARLLHPFINIKIPFRKWPENKLATRNLFRGERQHLPSTQTIIDKINNAHPVLEQALAHQGEVNLDPEYSFRDPNGSFYDKNLLRGIAAREDIISNPPLWYYILCETLPKNPISNENKSEKLGIVASVIIAETFYHLMQLNPIDFEPLDGRHNYIQSMSQLICTVNSGVNYE